MRILPMILIATLLPTTALAHPGTDSASSLLHGFQHPFSGIDHVLAMTAVGILAGGLGRRALLLVPLSFLGMMLARFLMGNAGIDLPLVEFGIAVSGIAIGWVAALRRPLPDAGVLAIVGLLALFHGHAHGAEMPAHASATLYAMGFCASTALLHLAGVLLGSTVLRRPDVRAAGR